MNKRMKCENSRDFQDFLNAGALEISREIKDRGWSRIQKRIHPNVMIIFAKVLSIHLVVGFVSLSICHQFHMNPFHTHTSLAEWLNEIGGAQFCTAVSGMLFLALSLAMASFFLSPEELTSLKKTKLRQAFVLSLISLSLFEAGGAEIAIGMSLIWIFGALVGGSLITDAMWKIKILKARFSGF